MTTSQMHTDGEWFALFIFLVSCKRINPCAACVAVKLTNHLGARMTNSWVSTYWSRRTVPQLPVSSRWGIGEAAQRVSIIWESWSRLPALHHKSSKCHCGITGLHSNWNSCQKRNNNKKKTGCIITFFTRTACTATQSRQDIYVTIHLCMDELLQKMQ